jgi:hypothetical protein
MDRMTDRKQARAMDLPEYPCPPSLGHVPAHAGSWGWLTAAATDQGSATLAQDADGFLWARSSKHLSPQPAAGLKAVALALWTEEGLGLHVAREAYKYIYRIDHLDELEWTPVAVVVKEPPSFSLDFGKN